MVDSGKEKRRFKRIYFSRKDNIGAGLRLPDKSKGPIKARVLNLSEGGIFLAPDPADDQLVQLSKGDHLTLTEISGTTPALDIDDTEMEVKWLFQDKFLDHTGLGCEFVNITVGTKKQLVQFVDSSSQDTLAKLSRPSV